VLFVQLGVEPTSRIVTDVQAPARAIPALQQVLRTKSSRLQVEAVRGLGGLSLEAHLALEDLIEAMKRDDKVLHRAIAEALSSLGVEAMVLLTRKLSDADARVREGAARALGRMGVSARSAVSALTRLLKDPESSVRTQAALALWLIDQQADVALSVLNLILKDVDNKDRWETVEAIGTIAVQAQPPIRGITEVLVNALKDRDIRVRLTAARWLFRRVRDAKVVVPLLRDGVSDRDLLARMTAVETLGEMRATDRVVPLLVQALDDRDPTVRLLATESLARLGAEAVSVLIDALDSKSARVRVGIARALTLLGPEAKKAHEAVKALSKDVDATVRSAAEEAREAIASVRD
jgi:HEAT repeat protein